MGATTTGIFRMKAIATLLRRRQRSNQAQMVTPYKDGERMMMSKRTGKLLRCELVECRPDAVRYFFVMRS